MVCDPSCGNAQIYLKLEIRCVLCRRCGKVKQEKFDFLGNKLFYTERFAFLRGQALQYSAVKVMSLSGYQVKKFLFFAWDPSTLVNLEFLLSGILEFQRAEEFVKSLKVALRRKPESRTI
jgi:hypothetical protein